MNGFNLEKSEDPKQSHDSGLGKVVAEQEAETNIETTRRPSEANTGGDGKI